MTDNWTEVRCVACVPLGWYSSHLLLRMQGKADGDGAKIEIKCPRCKSVIRWTLGKPEIIVAIEGVRNHKRQTVVFE